MTRILITGAAGQLGAEFQYLQKWYAHYIFFFKDKKDLDITNEVSVRKFMKEKGIEAIVNCAAFTQVDLAETEIQKASTLNRDAVGNLASVAKEQCIKLVHISTDYVFDGVSEHSFKESDKPNPLNVYGKTKWEGEQKMKRVNPLNSIIVRTSWLYSCFGKNFVSSMLELAKTKKEIAVVSDQVGSPTWARDLAKMILEILPKIENSEVETYHYSNQGKCSWHELARSIFELKNIPIFVQSIKSKEYPTKAKRPMYSAMSSAKIQKKFTLEIPSWKDSLAKCLEEL
jgi:dTDP-4-dehydrorhamnose reductase